MATVTKKNRTSKEIQKFMEKVYSKAEEEIKEYMYQMNKTDEEIRKLMECANFIYEIDKSSREFDEAERFIVIAVLNMISKDDEWIERFIEEYFDGSLKEMLEFYGYFIDEDDRKAIINRTFKGFNYKQRIKKNQKAINKRIENRIKTSIRRKNSLKNIEHWLRGSRRMSFKRAKELLVSELSRIFSDAFIQINKDQILIYNSVLEENTCADCKDMHGTLFKAKDAKDIIPQHTNCKCYWEIYIN